MSRNPWPKSARVTTPLMPPPRVGCWECVAKDERYNRLWAAYQQVVQELIDTAADLAVAEGAPTE